MVRAFLFALVLGGAMAGRAEACLSGGLQYFFETAPPNVPAGLTVLSVHLTSAGPEFERWWRLAPTRRYRRLVGMARRHDGAATAPMPVYARITSCAHEFDRDPPLSGNRETYLVGRIERLDGAEIFIARGRRWSVRPGDFDPD